MTGVVMALAVPLVVLGLGFGAYKILDWLYRLWAGGGMNRM